MGGGILLAGSIAGLACFGTGTAVALRLPSRLQLVLAAYVLAWVGLVSAASLLSLPGLLSRWSLSTSCLVLGAIGVAIRWRAGKPPFPSVGPAARDALGDTVVRLLALSFIPAAAYLTALAFLTTPNDWDGLTYHETRALLWDEQGGVGYVAAGNDPRLNGNPPVAEIGLYLAMLLARSERFAALPQFLALAACAVAVGLLARRIGLERSAAAYSALVFASLPIVLLHGAAIHNDLVVASFLLASAVFLTGERRGDLALGALALALALSTKFTAVLSLPVLLAVVVAVVPRSGRRAALVAWGAGALLGSPWYLINLAETRSPDGDLGEATGQVAEHSLVAIAGTLRALTFDVADTSGLWGDELVVPLLVGGGLVVSGFFLTVRGARGAARLLLAGGLVVALVPALLRGLETPLQKAWTRGWLELGHEKLAYDHIHAWTVLGLPDTSLSWYGATGAIVIFAGPILALKAARLGARRLARLVLAVAPLAFITILAVTIAYDPWRGRLLVFVVGLACAAWGATLGIRWLSVGVATLSVITVGLSLIHSYTKPSGHGLFEPPLLRSVWSRDRVDTITVIRDYDGTSELLRTVEAAVPPDAELAVATPIDTFLAPLAGPDLDRNLTLVTDGGSVPHNATWLVTRSPATAVGCPSSWQTMYTDEPNRWRILKRRGRDTCGAETETL